MTEQEIIKMAKQAGGRFSRNPDEYDVMKITYCGLEAFAKLVAEKEREWCASFIEDLDERGFKELAGLIRARGQK